MSQSCATCVHWAGTPGKHGRPLNRPGRCQFPIPNLPPLPFVAVVEGRWPPVRMAAWPDDGAECQTWTAAKCEVVAQNDDQCTHDHRTDTDGGGWYCPDCDTEGWDKAET